MYALGIDLGTTFTAAAVWREGRAEICTLGTRTASIPSVVWLRDDDSILTGEAANRRALTEPQRVAREFKRRFGDSTPVLLAGAPYSPEALTARLLSSVVAHVSSDEGEQPAQVCISHPANWGPFKTDLLSQAVRLADLRMPVSYTTEPEAAAVFYAREQRLAVGEIVAVYDLGGGTFDAAVLQRTQDGFEILGQPEGIERLGGIDIDAAVFNHVTRALGDQLQDLDEDDPSAVAAVARLRQECTEAKEGLSTDTDVTIPVLLPGLSTEVRLTRAELETMVRPSLYDSIEAMKRALRSADVEAEDLAAVLLVGGSSRMPLVAQLVGSELGRPVAVDAHPKHSIALGAAWLASGRGASAPASVPATRVVTTMTRPQTPAAAAPVPTPPVPSAPVPSAPVPSPPVLPVSSVQRATPAAPAASSPYPPLSTPQTAPTPPVSAGPRTAAPVAPTPAPAPRPQRAHVPVPFAAPASVWAPAGQPPAPQPPAPQPPAPQPPIQQASIQQVSSQQAMAAYASPASQGSASGFPDAADVAPLRFTPLPAQPRLTRRGAATGAALGAAGLLVVLSGWIVMANRNTNAQFITPVDHGAARTSAAPTTGPGASTAPGGTGTSEPTSTGSQAPAGKLMINVRLSGPAGSVHSDDGQINCPGSCAANYGSGAVVVLRATGNGFVGWTGCLQPDWTTCTLTGNRSFSPVANYQAPAPIIRTKTPTRSASASPSPSKTASPTGTPTTSPTTSPTATATTTPPTTTSSTTTSTTTHTTTTTTASTASTATLPTVPIKPTVTLPVVPKT